MDSKEKKQSHNQYRRRKNRVKIKSKYEIKLEKKSNEIKDIDEEIERLYSLKKQKEYERNEIKEEEFQKLAICYNNQTVIKEIIDFGRNTTFSRSVIDDIEKRCQNGINVDDVDLELLQDIALADETIIKQIPHTNKLGDIFNDIGESISFPGEENLDDN